MKQILVTGGTGYIGSHTCIILINAGYRVTILDNFSNSEESVLDRIEAIAGVRPKIIRGDIRDRNLLRQVFAEDRFDAVFHFAAPKAVGESVRLPLEYFDCNVTGTITLLQEMLAAGVKVLVFSSSAAVYGEPAQVPVDESFPFCPTNPYARSKAMVEEILDDLYRSDPSMRIAKLRYFNPAGAHESGKIGEDPKGTPNNLIPFVAQVAVGWREELFVFGDDYPTRDGTGVRDYIHVMDLAEGHLSAFHYLENNEGMLTVNLGTGKGYSVLEIIKAFEEACGHKIKSRFVQRRQGDVAENWALPDKALRLLGWKASRSLEAMCKDAWRWQLELNHERRKRNP